MFLVHDRSALLSIHDEDLRPLVSIGQVRVGFIITGLKTGSGYQHKFLAIFEPDGEFSFQDEQDMTSRAPMVRLEAGRVFDHANPNIPCFKCATERCACLAPVFDRGKLAPIGDCKHEALDIHDRHIRKSRIRHIKPTSSSQEERAVGSVVS